MASAAREREDANLISRRVLIKTAGVAAGAVALAPRLIAAQTPAPMAPPSTGTTPPPDLGPNAPRRGDGARRPHRRRGLPGRSEEHTSELQSLRHIGCRPRPR